MLEGPYTVWLIALVGVFGLLALVDVSVTLLLAGARSAAGEGLDS